MIKTAAIILSFVIFISCTNTTKYLYGKINTQDLLSSTKIQLKYVYLDDKNEQLFEGTLPVSLFGFYKIKKNVSAKIMLVYISQSRSMKSNSNPFIMENIYKVDLSDLPDNRLPEIIISSPVQVIHKGNIKDALHWIKINNADYYRIDFQKTNNDIFDALFFIPSSNSSFDFSMIANVEELKEYIVYPDYKNKYYFIKNEQISSFNIEEMHYYQITAFKVINNKSMQLTLPIKKPIVNDH